MIDKNKIAKAARKCLAAFRKANPDGYSSSIIDIESNCLKNFKDGAKWAINEFLKNLWHPASEEPDVRHKTIICLYDDGDIRQDYDVYDEAIKHDTFLGIGKFNWNDYAENEEIKKWCYATDLLPKEEGENERT